MDDRQTFEVPGVGEIRSRVGTSTSELAGAAKFWHDKSKHAWRDGFLTACVALGSFGIAAGVAIHFLL